MLYVVGGESWNLGDLVDVDGRGHEHQGRIVKVFAGVMIESRSHQAARFGLRALGRHPVISSTLRSSSAQRPLFA